jgi:hypothetical protein
MSRVRRYSRSGPTAGHLRSPTGLSPPAVTRSSGLRLKGARAARRLPPPPAHSSNPPQASPAGYSARGVWAPPRSLAATEGILSVPRGTEMFQFPRCPLKACTLSARPCAGRVAPFGHPRIPGCQRLPGAFRRVAASFLGRQRQGIHHAPFMRIPDSVHIQQTSWPRHQTGTRQRDVSLPAARLPAAVPERRSDEPGRILSPSSPPAVAIWVTVQDLLMFVIDVSMQCARATRHKYPAPLPLPGPKARLGHTTPEGFVCSRGRRTRRFHVAHCQGTSEVVRPLQKSLNPRPWISAELSPQEAVRPRLELTNGIGVPAWLLRQTTRWSRGDSNPGPPPCKGGALPAKLRPRTRRPLAGGRAWTRTRDLGLIRAALSPPELRARR